MDEVFRLPAVNPAHVHAVRNLIQELIDSRPECVTMHEVNAAMNELLSRSFMATLGTPPVGTVSTHEDMAEFFSDDKENA